MAKENWKSKILCTCVVRAEVDISAPDSRGGNERITCVLSAVDGKTGEGEDVTRTQATNM